MKFKFNPLIFRIQKKGGITTLWSSLLDFDKNNKLGNKIPENFLGDDIEISKPSRFIYAIKDDFYLNSYHTIKIGPGLSLCVCHDLMEERKIGLRSLLKRIYIYLSYLSADKIVCVSDKTFNEFSEFYPNLINKCCVILNPLPSDYIEFKPKIPNLKSKDKFLFLYVGKRNGEKNFDEGLKALCDSKIKNFNLICVGSAFTKKEISSWKKLIDQGKLSCLVNVSNEELISLYSKADFLFLPSRDEGFGLPIIETLCIGTPLIILYQKAVSIIDYCCYVELKSETNCEDLHKFLEKWIYIAPKISNKIKNKFDLNIIKSNYREHILNLINS